VDSCKPRHAFGVVASSTESHSGAPLRFALG